MHQKKQPKDHTNPYHKENEGLAMHISKFFRLTRVFVPSTLKNKLFLAVFIFIIVPFIFLFVYLFNEIESILQEKVSKQAHREIENMNQRFNDLRSIAIKSLILLKNDTEVRSLLENPYNTTVLNRHKIIENKLANIDNSLFPYDSPLVYFTLADLHGNMYSSYMPREKLDYDKFITSYPVQQMLQLKNFSYQWVSGEHNNLKNYSRSSDLLSLYAVLTDSSNKSYGIVRIDIDYRYLFNTEVKNSLVSSDLFIISKQEEIIFSSSVDKDLQETVSEIAKFSTPSGYFIDEKNSNMVSYTQVSDLEWFIVSKIPSETLFEEINLIKKRLLMVFGFFAIAFILITALISSTITRPLRQLQKQMSNVVADKLKVNLSENNYRGEILELTKSFNKMVIDMNNVVNSLIEERLQKEKIHFQMLLAQMNPHFLLNTLNTIKFIAIREGKHDIVKICVDLGKLLETSLNSEKELIHLKDERDLIEAYINIMRFRFGDKFQIKYEIDEDLNFALVPKLSLQPLVENSIYHGFSEADRSGLIKITAYSKNKMLHIEVEDNGIGTKKTKKERQSSGIGLSNLRERLGILFKKDADIQLVPLSRGVVVRLRFPLLLSVPYSKGEAANVDSINCRR